MVRVSFFMLNNGRILLFYDHNAYTQVDYLTALFGL